MATPPESYPEEECFNVYWKIKNFNPCCEELRTPEFYFDGRHHCIQLNMDSVDVQCLFLEKITYWEKTNSEMQISFLTCNGSPEISISSGTGVPKDLIFGNRTAFLSENTLTVRFRLLSNHERKKLFISSTIGVKRYYFLRSLKSELNLEYVAMKQVENSELYGHIVLMFKSVGGINSAPQISTGISRYGGNKCYCFLKLSPLDVNGEAVNEVRDEFVFEKKKEVWKFPPINWGSKCIGHENLMLNKDELSLKCYFAVYLGTVTDQSADIRYCENVTHLQKRSENLSMMFREENSSAKLQADLKRMLEDGTLSDVSLQIGSEVIQAHKNILSARSPVFKAMFAQNMKEAIKNKVVIEDSDAETVRSLILYIYTDSIHDGQWENMKKLYFVADKYEVPCLKKKCASFLKTHLSINNVIDALGFANLYQDEVIKTAAIDFISENDSEVFASKEWQELEKDNSSLALKFMRETCCNKPSKKKKKKTQVD